ncbi:hypothetical protein DY000_02064382, partial [Brassica cretica]
MVSRFTTARALWSFGWTLTVVPTTATTMRLSSWTLTRPSLRRRWEGYLGERTDGQKPIFGVRRSSMIGRNSVTVEVYAEYECNEYLIEGNFGQRSCTVVEAETRRKVAEIRRKVDASTNVMLGKDVFSLNVKAGFDGAFAMGLVLVLDQIYGDDYVEVGEEQTEEAYLDTADKMLKENPELALMGSCVLVMLMK